MQIHSIPSSSIEPKATRCNPERPIQAHAIPYNTGKPGRPYPTKKSQETANKPYQLLQPPLTLHDGSHSRYAVPGMKPKLSWSRIDSGMQLLVGASGPFSCSSAISTALMAEGGILKSSLENSTRRVSSSQCVHATVLNEDNQTTPVGCGAAPAGPLCAMLAAAGDASSNGQVHGWGRRAGRWEPRVRLATAEANTWGALLALNWPRCPS